MDKNLIDLASFAVVLGTLAEWLPPLAAAASLIWTGMRIWDWLRGR